MSYDPDAPARVVIDGTGEQIHTYSFALDTALLAISGPATRRALVELRRHLTAALEHADAVAAARRQGLCAAPVGHPDWAFVCVLPLGHRGGCSPTDHPDHIDAWQKKEAVRCTSPTPPIST